jgi:hypothetical protein
MKTSACRWSGSRRLTKPPWGFENALQLRVALLSAERTERLLDDQKISAGALGIAPPDVSAVYVFCQRV